MISQEKAMKNKMPTKTAFKSSGSNHVVRGNQGPEKPTQKNEKPSRKSGTASGGSNHVQNLPAHQK